MNLSNLTRLLSNFAFNESDKPVMIKNFEKINSSVDSCYQAMKDEGLEKDYKKCKSYCEFYNFNADSPVLEGNQDYYNKIIESL